MSAPRIWSRDDIRSLARQMEDTQTKDPYMWTGKLLSMMQWIENFDGVHARQQPRDEHGRFARPKIEAVAS